MTDLKFNSPAQFLLNRPARFIRGSSWLSEAYVSFLTTHRVTDNSRNLDNRTGFRTVLSGRRAL